MTRTIAPAAIVALTFLAACADDPPHEVASVASVAPGLVAVVRDTMIPDRIEVPATTEPILQASLGTRLMGRVTAVHVREGETVPAGALLVQLDDSELAAKSDQVDAGIRAAEAAYHEATLQANRIRGLYADSAAPRAQLDAVEAGLVRAEQGVRGARAAAAELAAVAEYATIRAPFAGLVAQRFVDVGSFAAPGSPLVRIEDVSRLRVVAAFAPGIAAQVRTGATLVVTIEGVEARGVVEGKVPAPGAALVNVQVLVDNRDGRFSPGSSATVQLEGPPRTVIVVPAGAVIRTGDLTGVRVETPDGVTTRWVRLGRPVGDLVEVLSGLAVGESILMTGVESAGA